jgi:uncharacterized caspase-like protein
MLRRSTGLIASLLLIYGIASGTAGAESRLALVIGNSDYRDVVALPNPAKDANAMDEFLRGAGFDVTPANNLTQSEMRNALRAFADKVADAGSDAVALVYYAGHGVQIDGENFLIPVDARIKREGDVAVAAVRLVDVMNILSAVPAKTRIVILDACRNNPFAAIDKTIGRGLAIVDAPRGSIVSYSTAPGATALDGAGDHSPFTAALLDVATTPGQPVEQTFKKVRLFVNKATDGQQTPWESSSLVSDFAFFGAPATPTATAAKTGETPRQEAAQAEKAQPEVQSQTVAMWKEKLIKLSPEEAYDLVVLADTVEAYKAFLTLFPKFKYVVRVRKLVDRRLVMFAWYDAFTINTVAAYQHFLELYPDSDLTSTAKRLLERTKNRSLSPDALAAIAPPPKVVTKIVEKIVEKPVPKIVERIKVVEKPVTRIVKQVVRVPVPCVCDGGRRPTHRSPGKPGSSGIHVAPGIRIR